MAEEFPCFDAIMMTSVETTFCKYRVEISILLSFVLYIEWLLRLYFLRIAKIY